MKTRELELKIKSPVMNSLLLKVLSDFWEDKVIEWESDYVCKLCGKKKDITDLVLHKGYFICLDCAKEKEIEHISIIVVLQEIDDFDLPKM